MDLPLEALKMVSEAVPVQGEMPHHMLWTPESGFVLFISNGTQTQPLRFDFGDTIKEIKEEITMLTGIPMPEQKKKETKKEGPPMDKEASKTPLLDGIKEAVLGGENLGSLTSRSNAQQAALNAALGSTTPAPSPITPMRTSRPGLLSRISNFQQSVIGESPVVGD